MRRTGKPSTKPDKPSPTPSGVPATAQVQGEGSYSGTRDYQEGVKSYLRTADVEQDARNAAPADAEEARELAAAEAAARKGRTRTSANGK